VVINYIASEIGGPPVHPLFKGTSRPPINRRVLRERDILS